MEKALLRRVLDVDALIQALEALPQDLHPTPTPGTFSWPTQAFRCEGKIFQLADLCSIAKLYAFVLVCFYAKSWLLH